MLDQEDIKKKKTEIPDSFIFNGLKTPLISTTSIDLVQVLDPIDGTRGFVKASEALYVVRCALFIFLFSERQIYKIIVLPLYALSNGKDLYMMTALQCYASHSLAT